MKHVRSALLAALALAAASAIIQPGAARAEQYFRVAQQQAGSCLVTVVYRDERREAKTKSTCIKEGEARCNTLQNSFCEPVNHPDVISSTCKIVASCPDESK